jgi:alkyldihydroxyacetonephosphate synthase
MPSYRAQRPDRLARAFVAAKSALDPAEIMNPGVLADGL